LNSQKNPPENKRGSRKSGFVPVKARWIIERSNAWMERCKILIKNFERTLDNATTKINLCWLYGTQYGSVKPQTVVN
jgi:hypothetical protein